MHKLESQNDCPSKALLEAALGGKSTPVDWDWLESHLEQCPACEATLDAITEQSDTCVRQLCQLPSTEDDEPTYQALYRQLIESTPQKLARAAPMRIDLPFDLGQYKLQAPLGHGANGSVFRALHVPLDRTVAVKLLKPDLDFDSTRVDRFVQETRAIGKLDHPHIVRATDAGQVDGQHYLAMEYVPGVDLSRLLEQTGPLAFADACEILRQATMGLAYLHEHGFVHRDVKPSNLLLTSSGKIKLLDLGLAKSANSDGASSSHALPHGTADYMSPEQWQAYDDVECRSDLYSLGCTLCKLLTGHPPFRPTPAGYPSKSEAHLNAAIPDLTLTRPDVPSELQSLFAQLLAKRPTQRCASALQLAKQLEPLARGANLRRLVEAAGLEPVAEPAPQAPLRWNWSRRQTVLAATAIVLSLVWLVGPFWQPSLARPQLRADTWRVLQPIPSVPGMRGDDQAVHQQDDGDAIVVAGDGTSMVSLGRPIAEPYLLEVCMEQMGMAAAGVFFKWEPLERSRLEPNRRWRCQAITMHRTVDGLCHGTWSVLQFAADGEPQRVVLAAAARLDVGRRDQEVLRVQLGLEDVPVVHWSGRPLQWELTAEGRSALAHGGRTYALGQLGLIVDNRLPVEEGAATDSGNGDVIFSKPRLSYKLLANDAREPSHESPN